MTKQKAKNIRGSHFYDTAFHSHHIIYVCLSLGSGGFLSSQDNDNMSECLSAIYPPTSIGWGGETSNRSTWKLIRMYFESISCCYGWHDGSWKSWDWSMKGIRHSKPPVNVFPFQFLFTVQWSLMPINLSILNLVSLGWDSMATLRSIVTFHFRYWSRFLQHQHSENKDIFALIRDYMAEISARRLGMPWERIC